MRPHRCRAAATIAASVASLVTSASNATHSPPDCRAMATVSSAEDRLLSTASTLAPSCTKRSTVARPLPIPSPGDWPAPTTIAILSLRRMSACPTSEAQIAHHLAALVLERIGTLDALELGLCLHIAERGGAFEEFLGGDLVLGAADAVGGHQAELVLRLR